MSLVRWFWAFCEKSVLARKMGQNERIFVCLSTLIGKIEANKIAESFPTYQLSLSKFDRMDPSYQTSKAKIR